MFRQMENVKMQLIVISTHSFRTANTQISTFSSSLRLSAWCSTNQALLVQLAL